MVGVDALLKQSSGRVVTAGELARAGASQSLLAVSSSLAPLLPHGALQRGRVYACNGVAAMSLAVSLAARATQEGSWLAFVDVPTMGYGAVRDHGVALQRVVSVGANGTGADWARVLSAIIDGFDIVIVPKLQCSASDARRIVARVQAQSAVLITVGVPQHVTPDVELHVGSVSWQFHSHACAREVHVSCHGRRIRSSEPRRLLVPAANGAVGAMS